MKILLALFIVLAITACSKPISEDRAAYIGRWEAEGMSLIISADGRVVYHKQSDGVSTNIDAPLIEFVENDFVVGLGFINTTFDVTEAPHLVGGRWLMVVDGMTLVKN